MAEGTRGESQPKKISRRGFLIGVGSSLAGLGIGALIGRQTSDSGSSEKTTVSVQKVEQLTPEQQGKQNALRSLRDFTEQYTHDKTVSNFIANSSADDIQKAFTIGEIKEKNPTSMDFKSAWQLRLPVGSSDPNLFLPTVSFVPPKSGKGAELRMFLDKEGKIRQSIKEADLKADYLTEEEMEKAFGAFAINPAFRTHHWNPTPWLGVGAISIRIAERGYDLDGLIDKRGEARLAMSVSAQSNSPSIPKGPEYKSSKE